jgi:hypothetical protein
LLIRRTQLFDENVILADATGGNVVINLVAANNVTDLITIRRVDASANTVTINADGSELIDGDASLTVAANTAVQLAPKSGAWYKISNFLAEAGGAAATPPEFLISGPATSIPIQFKRQEFIFIPV